MDDLNNLARSTHRRAVPWLAASLILAFGPAAFAQGVGRGDLPTRITAPSDDFAKESPRAGKIWWARPSSGPTRSPIPILGFDMDSTEVHPAGRSSHPDDGCIPARTVSCVEDDPTRESRQTPTTPNVLSYPNMPMTPATMPIKDIRPGPISSTKRRGAASEAESIIDDFLIVRDRLKMKSAECGVGPWPRLEKGTEAWKGTDRIDPYGWTVTITITGG